MAAEAPATRRRSRSATLSQKLRDLRRLKLRTEDKEEQKYEIVHTPDRPARIVSPIEAPTESECGFEIARWHHLADKERSDMSTKDKQTDIAMVGLRSLNHPRGRIEEWERQERCKRRAPDLTTLNRQDESTTVEDDDDDGHIRRHHATNTELVHDRDVQHAGHGKQQTPPMRALPLGAPYPMVQPQAVRPEPKYTGKQLHQARLTDLTSPRGIPDISYEPTRAPPPTPVASSTGGSTPSVSLSRSISPALATVGGNDALARTEGFTGRNPQGGKEEHAVDMEQLVRMEKYRRGVCPFCHHLFNNNKPFPLDCPNQACKRDLRVCLDYPTRRLAKKAPPRLADRPFLPMQPRKGVIKGGQGLNQRGGPVPTPARPQAASQTQAHTRGYDWDQREVIRRKAIADLRAEKQQQQQQELRAARPDVPPPPPTAPLQPRKPPSPSDSTHTAWPSPTNFQSSTPPHPLRIKGELNKPLPTLPPPTPACSARRQPPLAQVQAQAQPMTRSGSAPEQHQHKENEKQQQQQKPFPVWHIAAQLRQPSPSPPPSSSMSSSAPNTSSLFNSLLSSSAPTTREYFPRVPPPQSRFRGMGSGKGRARPVTANDDDIDILAWKRPEEREEFERDIRKSRESGDLFMDIYEQYDDGEMARAGFI